MIQSDREYQVAKEEADKFEQSLAQADERTAHLHPRLRQAMREGLQSKLEELREDIAEYEAIRDGRALHLRLPSFAVVAQALPLVRARGGVTREELAERLGWSVQEIRQLEATEYAGASVAQVQAVLDALGVKVHPRLLMPVVEPFLDDTLTGDEAAALGSNVGK